MKDKSRLEFDYIGGLIHWKIDVQAVLKTTLHWGDYASALRILTLTNAIKLGR